MKRNRILAVLLALVMVLSPATTIFARDWSGTSTFDDVEDEAWYHGYVENLAKQEIVSGYGDGTFGPNNYVTRQQAAKMIALAAGLKAGADFKSELLDLGESSAWAYPYIYALEEAGVIAGFGDSKMFKPQDYIRRGHIAKMLVLAFGLSKGDLEVHLTDIKNDLEKEYIEILASNGIVKGFGETGQFLSLSYTSRAQFAKMVAISQAVAAVQRAEADDATPEDIAQAETLIDNLPDDQDPNTKAGLKNRLVSIKKDEDSEEPVVPTPVVPVFAVSRIEKSSAYVNDTDATTLTVADKTITIGGAIPYQAESISGHDPGHLYELKFTLANVKKETAAFKSVGSQINTYAAGDNWLDGANYFYFVGSATIGQDIVITIDNDGVWETTKDAVSYTIKIAAEAVLATPVNITAFDAIADINGGSVGAATYGDTSAVQAALPTRVTANKGAVSVPVGPWIDTDGYNPAEAGSYTFTAALGPLPAGFTNTDKKTATVEVVIQDGTAQNPYLIDSLAKLLYMATLDDLPGTQYFTQTADIDLSGHAWMPFDFSGHYDGNGKIISNVTINQADTDNVGFFSHLSTDGVLIDVHLNNVTVVGQNYVGALVGYSEGSITNCSATGSVTGLETVGGLLGRSGAAIRNCHTTINVSGTNEVGGLAGYSWESITDSYTSGSITGIPDPLNGSSDYVGGLVGFSNGSILGSYSSAGVTGSIDVGGLAGYSLKSITNSYATGQVKGSRNVGGLAGYSGGSISDSFASGEVTGSSENIGGLAGYSSGSITKGYATGAVTGSRYVGGLVGDSENRISDCYASGAVSGSSGYAGGLVGNSRGSVSGSYAKGAVSGKYDCVGGLIGYTMGSVSDSYATGSVSGINYVGGLVGSYDSDISNSYAIGKVTGSSCVGCLVGCAGSITASSTTNSYYDSITTGQTDNGIGIPKSTVEMKEGEPTPDIYTSWSQTIWSFGDDTDYPKLIWELN